jgi:subtilisin family serine protease
MGHITVHPAKEFLMIESSYPLPSDDMFGGLPGNPPAAETTGRYIVVFGAAGADPSPALHAAGLSNVADSREFSSHAVDLSPGSDAGGWYFASLGIAVVSAEPGQLSAMAGVRQNGAAVLSVSPELVHHILDDAADYTSGYRDGVTDLSKRLQSQGSSGGTQTAAQASQFQDTADFTWGLQATKTVSSSSSGKGIKVAVLDTGFDTSHPDFDGRTVTTYSFISGEDAQDGHGHGTHCIGTSCGPRKPSTGRRYGIAYEAEIYAGKVLSNAGSGSDAGILAGIDWAIKNGCAVISMSLGADVAQPHPPYTAAGSRALDQGTLIVAAAGNNANRPAGNFGFVGAPANSPYIMAVGALDGQLSVAPFSARSLESLGGQVDVAGPGYQVYSSWLMPTRYRTISGTSMATPHAAGIAALLAEATGYRGRELWAELVQQSQRLLAPSVDVGSGMVNAPQ